MTFGAQISIEYAQLKVMTFGAQISIEYAQLKVMTFGPHSKQKLRYYVISIEYAHIKVMTFGAQTEAQILSHFYRVRTTKGDDIWCTNRCDRY